MNYLFKITAGNLSKVAATLMDSLGATIDLTGSTVKFLFQGPGVNYSRPAAVVDAVNGKVQYQFATGETAVPGDYIGQWQVIDGSGNTTNVPECPFHFAMLQGVPVSTPAQFTNLSDFYDDIRAVVGDFKRRLYEDSAIQSVMRMHLRMGRIKQEASPAHCGNGPVTKWTLAADAMTLTPAMENTDIVAYGLLVYQTAKTLILPNQQAYSYRTRALSERFGEAKDFLVDLENVIYELENGSGVFVNVSGLRNWLFAINGIWVWSYLQAEQTVDLSFH